MHPHVAAPLEGVAVLFRHRHAWHCCSHLHTALKKFVTNTGRFKYLPEILQTKYKNSKLVLTCAKTRGDTILQERRPRFSLFLCSTAASVQHDPMVHLAGKAGCHIEPASLLRWNWDHHAGVMEVKTQGVGSSLVASLLLQPSDVNHLRSHTAL